jgi:hypothetical protein
MDSYDRESWDDELQFAVNDLHLEESGSAQGPEVGPADTAVFYMISASLLDGPDAGAAATPTH